MSRRGHYAKLQGRVFGNLTAVRREGSHKRYAVWRCLCICGQQVLVSSDKLVRGLKKSCGVNGHHFWLNFISSPELLEKLTHTSWDKMHERCAAKTGKHFKNYVARGITVCERWNKFENFLADMGRRPSKQHSIERKNNDGNYEPANCLWATASEQASNKRNNVFVEYQGERRLLLDVVAEFGVPRGVVYQRLKIGWKLEDALFTPVREKKKRKKRP